MLKHLLFTLMLILAVPAAVVYAESPREVIGRVVLLDDSEEQAKLVSSLSESGDEEVVRLLTQWKEGVIFILEKDDGTKVPVLLDEEKDENEQQLARDFVTSEPLKAEGGEALRVSALELEIAETDSQLRVVMKRVADLIQLSGPDEKKRLRAVETLGMEQNPEHLEALRLRQGKESVKRIQRAIREAIALIQIKAESDEEKIAACRELGELGSIPSQDFLKSLLHEMEGTKPDVARAAAKALKDIEQHVSTVNTIGTVFRGLSTGSILLVVAIGLAITFGLMGVINMAHGEMIVVGAYTTYVVQCLFGNGLALSLRLPIHIGGNPLGFSLNLPGMHAEGWRYDSYFILALPLSFLMAALVGVALERGVIRFLYRRPLESLLATWGVSLVLQQLFRLVFGANNVQVDSPAWLSGNWTVNDIMFGWNRVFVIGFAVAIVAGVYLLLTKTSLGLLIRAVMQNRGMAACMGVRTERVNMMTFALGSGLAGLAGAFLSQIGNVGPSLGQNYIVDSFMTVVVGGVGNLFGTVISALGIGMMDQSLQQTLGNPVLGKILVLAGIILFLQWRPAGLFVSKSRTLEG